MQTKDFKIVRHPELFTDKYIEGDFYDFSSFVKQLNLEDRLTSFEDTLKIFLEKKIIGTKPPNFIPKKTQRLFIVC